jgi:hypothetical protein
MVMDASPGGGSRMASTGLCFGESARRARRFRSRCLQRLEELDEVALLLDAQPQVAEAVVVMDDVLESREVTKSGLLRMARTSARWSPSSRG